MERAAKRFIKGYLPAVDSGVLRRAREHGHGDKLHHLRDGGEALGNSCQNWTKGAFFV